MSIPKAKSPKAKLAALKREQKKKPKVKLVAPIMDAETACLIQRLNDRITKLEAERSKPKSLRDFLAERMSNSHTHFQLGHISYDAKNHGARWDYNADQSLCSKFQCGNKDLVVLGKMFGRTPFAVFAHLVKLGQINETDCYELWAGVTDKARGL